LNTSENAAQVEGLRATITWTVEPVIVPGYSVSTWIALGVASPGEGVSNQIAQIGWIETDPGQPHLFWEWGTSTADSHKQIGKAVEPGLPLNVEVDLDHSGEITFFVDAQAIGTASVPWVPTAIGAFAETHTQLLNTCLDLRAGQRCSAAFKKRWPVSGCHTPVAC